MQRQEIPNNTAEQVEEYLTLAAALADKLCDDPDRWGHYFTQAAQLISGKQIVMIQPQPLDLSALNIRGRH